MAESIGSIRVQVAAQIPEIPTTLSGNVLGSLIDLKRIFIQNYTGDTVSATDIPEKYQQPLIDLSSAALLTRMMTVGVDASNIRLGDWSENLTGDSNIAKAAKLMEEQGMMALKYIGTSRFTVGKANG